MNMLKPLLFSLSLLPLATLMYSVMMHSAGPNPIETIEQQTGEWSLRFLLLSLAMTPLAQWLKQAWPIRIRRMIGLFAGFYVLLHLLAYVVLDQSLNLADILLDIVEKPFITAGFTAFCILLPLAITSNAYMVRKLKSRWHALHRWVYLAAVTAMLHYIWLVKGERLEPVIYLLVLLFLLSIRLKKIL